MHVAVAVVILVRRRRWKATRGGGARVFQPDNGAVPVVVTL